MIKSSVLTISVPGNDCDKNCPYCVSKMTFGVKGGGVGYMIRNIPKVKTIASSAGVTTVLFTGKGEPLLNIDDLFMLADTFREYPIEVQTNGKRLKKNFDGALLNGLSRVGVNVIAISIDNIADFDELPAIVAGISNYRMITRVTLNVCNDIAEMRFKDYVRMCRLYGVSHLTLRRVSIPLGAADSNEAQWIVDNKCDQKYDQLMEEATQLIQENNSPILRETNYGMQIYDLGDVSFAHSDYCIQEGAKGDDTRALIFQEDGHLYTSWNRKASVIF